MVETTDPSLTTLPDLQTREGKRAIKYRRFSNYAPSFSFRVNECKRLITSTINPTCLKCPEWSEVSLSWRSPLRFRWDMSQPRPQPVSGGDQCSDAHQENLLALEAGHQRQRNCNTQNTEHRSKRNSQGVRVRAQLSQADQGGTRSGIVDHGGAGTERHQPKESATYC